jgi:hypothetical protein
MSLKISFRKYDEGKKTIIGMGTIINNHPSMFEAMN